MSSTFNKRIMLVSGHDKSHISTTNFLKLAYEGKKIEEKKFYCSSASTEHIKLSQKRTMELFSTLQRKYSRNKRWKCDSIPNSMSGKKGAVDFMNNLLVGSGWEESLKTLSVIIYKLLNTEEEVKSNRT